MRTIYAEYNINHDSIARLYLDGNLQMWVDAEDSLEL